VAATASINGHRNEPHQLTKMAHLFVVNKSVHWSTVGYNCKDNIADELPAPLLSLQVVLIWHAALAPSARKASAY